ncbi:hypothetical protein K503DRAFT_859182 [Rhizopogon vinicolor AM-OR11-026]|uniref:Uncharacterized protein n=1 Tax=Rhizopogon vinicolor AM-OR11-026 TaxID=1314800 RepID=A0A1B7MPD4_9AGAM|nr:hypothetical protein K503DRAFT_859182 [Rhizopogon vinicolor AM-OR11-026]
MATKFELDNKSDTNAPPSYDAISTSASSRGLSKFIQSKWSWPRSNQKCATDLQAHNADLSCTTVLFCIRDLVTAADFTPSSVAPIVNTCAAALSPAEFSDLLQSLNIDDHTAIYWAIVNCRREAISAFANVGCLPFRLAHGMHVFTQLNLLRTIGQPMTKSLIRSLGCPPDEIEVHEADKPDAMHRFVTLFRFKMCQKRLRIIQNVGAEFVAGGRIWWLRIYMGDEGKWLIEWGLSQHSPPACPEAVFLIKSVVSSGPETLRIARLLPDDNFKILVPKGHPITDSACWKLASYLSDWPMDERALPEAVDTFGALM